MKTARELAELWLEWKALRHELRLYRRANYPVTLILCKRALASQIVKDIDAAMDEILHTPPRPARPRTTPAVPPDGDAQPVGDG